MTDTRKEAIRRYVHVAIALGLNCPFPEFGCLTTDEINNRAINLGAKNWRVQNQESHNRGFKQIRL